MSQNLLQELVRFTVVDVLRVQVDLTHREDRQDVVAIQRFRLVVVLERLLVIILHMDDHDHTLPVSAC